MKHYDEDLFAETRMSFGDHLEELRSHLIKAILGLVIGVVISFIFGGKVVQMITRPVEQALVEHYIAWLKQHGDEENRLIAAFRAELQKEEVAASIQRLNEPRPVEATLSARELDRQFRTLYPKLFAKGGALAETEPPAADAPGVPITATVRPMQIVTELQGVFSMLAKRVSLTTLSAPEMFFVYFKVCFLTGFVISSPWVFYQVWQFVAAGLYPREKKYVYWALGPSIFLFLCGVFLCQFVIIPKALDALLGFNLLLNVEPDFRLNEWLGFAIMMPVITGLCFQTPLVMFVLGKIGVFTAKDFAAKRRMAIFLMLIFTAFITPSIDIPSLLLMWLPMVVLYEVGIILVRFYCKPAPLDDEEVPYQPEAASANGPPGA